MNFAGSEKSNEAERPKSVSDCFYALANPPTERTYQREIRTERRSSRFHSSTRRFRAVISTRVACAPTASRRELAAHRKISLAKGGSSEKNSTLKVFRRTRSLLKYSPP